MAITISAIIGFAVYFVASPSIVEESFPKPQKVKAPSKPPEKFAKLKNPLKNLTDGEINEFIRQVKSNSVKFFDQVMDGDKKFTNIRHIPKQSVKEFLAKLDAGETDKKLARKALMEKRLFEGRAMYQIYCSNCHGANGAGHRPAAYRPGKGKGGHNTCHGNQLASAPSTAHGFVNLRFTSLNAHYSIRRKGEGYTYWRVLTGNHELPADSFSWKSSMPAWGGELSETEMWSAILGAYDLVKARPDEGEDKKEVAREPVKPPKTVDLIAEGRKIYYEKCSFCHGVTGAGNGPPAKFMEPRPRNFQTNVFKFRSTISGFLPLDEDLFKVISRGIPGTSMEPYSRRAISNGLLPKEIWAVIYYIQTFGEDPEFNMWMLDEAYGMSRDQKDLTQWRYNNVVRMGAQPEKTPELLARGKEIYRSSKCFSCHGDNGLGNGISVEDMKDDWKFPMYPRNLTKIWRYKGGRSVKDIFYRITTGINGTPMPAFLKSVSEKDRWGVAYYVKSLQRKPVLKPFINALWTKTALPDSPTDPAWEAAKRGDVFMFGNVVTPPRWRNNTIDHVIVKAMFNDDEIAIRLEWEDRFPNTIHLGADILSQKEQTAMKDGDKSFATALTASSPQVTYRDAIMLQFPQDKTKGMPYFLNGDKDNPVNLWWWRADYAPSRKALAEKILSNRDLAPLYRYVKQKGPEKTGRAALELNAKGIKDPFTTQEESSQALSSQAIFNDGVWSLVIKRPRLTSDSNDTQFINGSYIPFAINAWDGWNHNIGTKKSISKWSYIYLDRPKTSKPAMMGVFAFLVSFALLAQVCIRRKKQC
ncbi:hypothetical protein MNBD_NITROSPINAE01-1966 [hydrothermal vent metagenome]|uniref:Cytochrome c domain-containing protein n=1 Tax=hydrothermal vent metagenome TaxID=652676 RepID=A0A3B1BST5_9ZZZZ